MDEKVDFFGYIGKRFNNCSPKNVHNDNNDDGDDKKNHVVNSK